MVTLPKVMVTCVIGEPLVHGLALTGYSITPQLFTVITTFYLPFDCIY